MDEYISKEKFYWIGENLIKFIIEKEYHVQIDLNNLVLRVYRDKSILSYDEIIDKYCENESSVVISFVKNIILSDYSLKAFKHRCKINTLFVWRLIFDSLVFFRKNNPLAGIGSQGFLSIELFRFELDNQRKILRLHIWDSNFSKNFNENDFMKYKIHSHLFNAQSHVITGDILNNTYEILDNTEETENSLYSIKWKSSVNENGALERKSQLNIEKDNIGIKKISTEKISSGQSYSVSINDYHSSHSISPISATLFLFNSDEGLNSISKVVGPKNDSEPGFKYEKINFIPKLYDIDREVKKFYNKQILLALDWSRKIHILEHAHRIESRKLNNFSTILSWLIVLLPAMISGIAFYLKQFPDKKDDIILWVAILAALSTLLGTINKVIKPSNLSEIHRKNSEKFEHLRHKLEQHIVFNNDERLELFLEEIRVEWKKLTLHNVKEYNFQRASKIINKLKRYPNKLEFHE